MTHEKRTFQRYNRLVTFTISVDGKEYDAETLDYSIGGLSALIKGFPRVRIGDIVDLKIDRLNIKSQGKVVRVARRDDGIKLGFQKLGMIHGSLSDFIVPDLLIGFQRSSKTGVFMVKHEHMHKSVYFERGDMVFATSNQVYDRLGDMLVREGRITREQYRKSSEVMMETKKRHGTVLVEMGFLKPGDLFAAVKRSVENVILSTISLAEGEFLFKEGSLPTDEVVTLRLSAANLIHRGIMAIEDLNLLKNMGPKPEDFLRISSDPLDLFQSLNLDETERKLLTMVNGKRTFHEVAEISGLPLLQAVRIFTSFVCTRIVEVFYPDEETSQKDNEEVLKEASSGMREEVDIEALTRRVDEMYKRCIEQDYYSILGVSRTVERIEIKKAYYRMARMYHPDRHFELDGDIRDKLNTIFTYITTAYSTLTNPATRSEYDRKPRKPHVQSVDPSELAQKKFDQGVASFGAGRYADAITQFSEAAYLDADVAKYHYYAGLALIRGNRMKEAERSLQRAIKLDQFNPDFHAEVGYVYIAMGFTARAKGSFQKALKLSPMHRRAMEGISTLPQEEGK